MARRSVALARPIVVRQAAARPIIRVSAPRPIVSRRTRRALAHVGGRVLQAARDERHRLYAVGGAIAIGYAEKHGIALPHSKSLGMAGTYGLLGWAALKAGLVRSRSLSHVVTGLLSVAAYQFATGEQKL
jgi:hypothetical protein